MNAEHLAVRCHRCGMYWVEAVMGPAHEKCPRCGLRAGDGEIEEWFVPLWCLAIWDEEAVLA